jgi:hypothetical protein
MDANKLQLQLSIIGLCILRAAVFTSMQLFMWLWYCFDILTAFFQQPKLPGL